MNKRILPLVAISLLIFAVYMFYVYLVVAYGQYGDAGFWVGVCIIVILVLAYNPRL